MTRFTSFRLLAILGSLPLLLGQIGYGAQVVRGREAALAALKHAEPTLLIAGGSAGLNFYHALRRASPAPILALVPEADEERVLAAFAAGVDDCQAGPISNGEVVARVRAILRHVGQASPAAGRRADEPDAPQRQPGVPAISSGVRASERTTWWWENG